MATYIMDLGKHDDHVTACVELEADTDEEAVALLKDLVEARQDEPFVHQFSMLNEPIREVRIYLSINPDLITTDLIGDAWEESLP